MLPLRGATHQPGVLDLRGGISIHTPLAGSDRLADNWDKLRNISIHTPLAGNDWTGQDGTRERG